MAGKDGFWPIILKNSFAPLFCQQKFDYIFGNPPWIAWKAMSQSYRDLSLDIWLSYGIFEKSAYDKKTSHDDFAMAVTYVTIDHYLKDKGQACYVLPQTFIKGLKGGEGFRKFEITRDNQSIPIAIEEFHDMIEVKPFKGIAANTTAVYFFRKGEKMQYPMEKYFLYKIKTGEKIDSNTPYEEVRRKLVCENLWARPVNADDLRSPWLTMDENKMRDSHLYLGGSNYKGRKGIEPCGAKGVYLVDIIEEKNGLVKIENLVDRSRLQEVKEIGVRPGIIEKDCIYPMVGVRNIKSWGIDSYLYMVVPHSKNSVSETKYGISDATLKTNLPRTYNWLFDNWHDILFETRCRSGKFFNPQKYPWYKLDNVGPYTFQPYHVLWAEQGTTIKCCVVSSIEDKYLGNKLVVTDSKVLFVPLNSEMEAYYLCGVINSEPVETIIKAYTINTNKGTDIVDKICIPEFNETNPLQYKLATLSKRQQVIDFATEKLEERDCPMKTAMQMELVIEELFVNIASYAYHPDVGPATFCMEFVDNPAAVLMTFIDSGKPYNPLEKADPDTTLDIDQRKVGGLGIFLVKKNVDEIDYKHEGGKNILTMKKFF